MIFHIHVFGFGCFDLGIMPLHRNRRTDSRICLGCNGPVSSFRSIQSNASSTISPTKTLAIPDIAMTTFCETEQPVICWTS